MAAPARQGSLAKPAVRDRVGQIALALPEAALEHQGRFDTYLVRKKKFAYFLDNHHGDGIVCVAFSADLGHQAMLMELDPDRYLRPAYAGARGWTSLRLDRGKPNWDEVALRLREAYVRVAPKTLARAVSEER